MLPQLLLLLPQLLLLLLLLLQLLARLLLLRSITTTTSQAPLGTLQASKPFRISSAAVAFVLNDSLGAAVATSSGTCASCSVFEAANAELGPMRGDILHLKGH